MDKMVYGQNGIGQNASWTKWYGQNGTNKILRINSSINPALIYNMIFHQSRFHFNAISFPLCAYNLFVTFGYKHIILNSTELKFTQNIKLYHFVHTILSVPFCPISFCPYTILSAT